MNTYTYKLTTWQEGDTTRTTTYGKGGWDRKEALKNMNAAVRRTDKVEGLFAIGEIVTDSDTEGDTEELAKELERSVGIVWH